MDQYPIDFNIPQQPIMINTEIKNPRKNLPLKEQIKQILSEYGNHFVTNIKNDNSTNEIILNEKAKEDFESILFLSDSLLNVRSIDKEYKIQSQKLWKAFEICICEDGSASFVLQNIGLEYLKLLPKQDNLQLAAPMIGTFQIFYYFLAAYTYMRGIENEFLRARFQEVYEFGTIEYGYKLFGPFNLRIANPQEDLKKFNTLCRHLIHIGLSNKQLADFFDLIVTCIISVGEKAKPIQEIPVYGQDFEDDVSQGSLESTGLTENERIENQTTFINQILNQEIKYQVIDIYQQVADRIVFTISKLNISKSSVLKLQIIEQGEYSCNESNLQFSDLAMNYCKDVFDQYFGEQQDLTVKRKIAKISQIFSNTYQQSIGNYNKYISIQSIQLQLGKFSQKPPDPSKDPSDQISLYQNSNKYLRYDLTDLKNLFSLYRVKVLSMFETSQNSILSQCSKNVLEISILKYIQQKLVNITEPKVDFKLNQEDELDNSCKQEGDLKKEQLDNQNLNGNEDSVGFKSNNMSQKNLDQIDDQVFVENNNLEPESQNQVSEDVDIEESQYHGLTNINYIVWQSPSTNPTDESDN